MNLKQSILIGATIFTSLTLAACQTGGSATNTSTSADTTSSSYRPGDAGEQNAQAGSTSYREEEITLTSNGNRLWGKAYIPEGDGPHPLVIFSHELGTSHRTGESYAEYFASRGIAYYVFDFPGGSIGSNNSEGTSTNMSVMTEASDLQNIVAAARDWDFVDSSRIYLHGGSQGGMVSAVTASRIPDQIAGLVLAYPAFIIPDQLHQDYGQLSRVPDTFRHIGWIDVSRRYAEDVWDYDVYNEINAYTGPVLILHGDRDTTVPMSYAERAQSAYSNATLRVITGGGHEFFGNAFTQATDEMNTFFTEQGLYHH